MYQRLRTALIAICAVSPALAVDYITDIQPILRASCYSCHTGDKAGGGLRLDSKTAAFSGGASGKAIVPGNPEASLILRRLTSPDKSQRMPLGGTPLDPAKIDLIRRWV